MRCISQDDPDAAERWADSLFGAYRVFYRLGMDIEILSVRHGSQLIRAEEGNEE